MIGAITGLPGGGKTLYTLQMIKAKAEKENRPVYYSGIADLRLPWIELADPLKWMDCPANSIVVIDEAQRIFRPRMHGTTVPPHVAALETHRHLGIDIYVITQHPMLLDPNLRRLVGQHFHVVRRFGTKGATVHEWGSIKENCDKSRSDSTRHEWSYPIEAFSWYKSAEVHTHKRRIPAKLFFLLVIPVLLILAAWQVYRFFVPPPVTTAPGVSRPGVSAPGQAGSSPRVLTSAQYVDQFEPRVPGLHYTAPVYDKVTEPVRAPFPSACVATATRCSCYTEQATVLDVPDALCRQVVSKGFFVAWKLPDAPPESRVGGLGGTPHKQAPQSPAGVVVSESSSGVLPVLPARQPLANGRSALGAASAAQPEGARSAP